jgi:uncharacterized protein YndB with AHSA1/START domain
VGGRYFIANALPDGSTMVIEGEFREIRRPHLLVYTWRMGPRAAEEESLVTVRFEARGDDTEVVVVHEQVPSLAARESHEKGWEGCLDGLDAFFARP